MYDSPLTGTAGGKLFGQPAFDQNGCNANGLGAGSLCSPGGVALDRDGALYIADSGNNRVLRYGSRAATAGAR
jgi:sugar lactone lactonase YvrE